MKGKARTIEQKKEIFRSLEPYFSLGYSLNKACILAGIPPSTAHDIVSQEEELRMKMGALQSFVTAQARQVVTSKIIDAKDVSTAKWWLERKEPDEFQARQKVEAAVSFIDLGALRKIKEELDAKV
jgi:hypothetical protein